MANIKSFPNNQDVYIGAEDVMKWLHGRTSGVFGAANNATVSALVDASMAVTVSDGIGWMANAGKDGVVWWIDNEAVNSAKLQLPIDPADGVLNRIDRIIVEWKTTNYVDYPEVKVLKGSLSSRATAPALTNNSTVRQISLAKINVAAGTTAITASMVTDERLDASVCGLVTESISIDTSTIQNQFESLLSAIKTELQDINAGTAALLKAGGTMYGTLDMGGNKIKNVSDPTDDNDAVNKRFLYNALKNFESGISMELVWENANSRSAFKSQKIMLDLVNYDTLVLYSHTTATSESYVPGKMIPVDGNKYNNIDVGTTSGSRFTRDVTACTDGVVFSDGKLNGSVDNNTMIPHKIYGIKGVTA